MARPLTKLLANLGLAAGTIVVLLLAVELGLRLTGFSYVLYPEQIEFGKPDPELLETGFREDDDLFWVTKDYPEKLARMRRERPEIVFMGDSCTQFSTYDSELARIVAARQESELRYGNLAVAGWTTHQGLRQLERDVLPLSPRVVTIFYGWNDHWIGFGIADRNVTRIKRIFSSRWSGLRLVQLATKALVALDTRRTAYPNRVSLGDFAANLRRMVELSIEAGVRPVLITAPTSIREGEEPDYLSSRWLRDLSELLPLHRAYADSVREVAADEGAVLCDLERGFAELPRPEIDEAFMADGIHFTEVGSRRVAVFLYECLGSGIAGGY